MASAEDALGGAAPAGTQVLADFDADLLPDWVAHTAEQAVDYAKLQLDVSGLYMAAGTPMVLPVAPVAVARDVLTIALPADAVPWLRPTLVVQADPATGLEAADGQRVTLAFLKVSAMAAHMLDPATGLATWAADGRWPASTALAGGALALPAAITPAQVTPGRDYSGALPPGRIALSPSDLDAVLGGALASGPWLGLMNIQYPPGEPGAELSVGDVGPDGQRLSGHVTPPGMLPQTDVNLGAQQDMVATAAAAAVASAAVAAGAAAAPGTLVDGANAGAPVGAAAPATRPLYCSRLRLGSSGKMAQAPASGDSPPMRPSRWALRACRRGQPSQRAQRALRLRACRPRCHASRGCTKPWRPAWTRSCRGSSSRRLSRHLQGR